MVSETPGTGDSRAGGDVKCRESGRGVWRICPLWESSGAGGAALGGCCSGCTVWGCRCALREVLQTLQTSELRCPYQGAPMYQPLAGHLL